MPANLVIRRLTPPDLNPEGIQAGDWVRKVGRRGKGFVEGVKDNCAYVDWLNGKKEPIICVFLRLVETDVRPDLDRRGK